MIRHAIYELHQGFTPVLVHEKEVIENSRFANKFINDIKLIARNNSYITF